MTATDPAAAPPGIVPGTRGAADQAPTLDATLFQLALLARTYLPGADCGHQHCAHREDLARFSQLAGQLQARLNLRARRSSGRDQALRDELTNTLSDAFADQVAHGLTVVVNFQARLNLPRPLRPLARRWRVLREVVTVSTAWSPDNSAVAHCLWQRSDCTAPRPLTGHRLRRLDRIVRRLERRGYFDVANAAFYTGHAWMEEEPDAYPGLDRLMLTIAPATD